MAFRFRSWLAAAVPLVVLGGLGLMVWQGSEPPRANGNLVSRPAGGGRWIPMDLAGAEAVDRIPGWDVRRGNYRISGTEGNRVLELLPEPIVEGKVLWTRGMRGGGGVRARMRGDRSRRTFPRFSLGLHQERELHLRAFPGDRKLDLVACDPDLSHETLLASVPLPGWDWKPGDWTWMEFRILSDSGEGGNGSATCEGRVWTDGQARPESAQLAHRLNLPRAVFFAALQGAPFALKPILINAAETLPP